MSNPHLKNIIKLFETCRHRHDLYAVFSDWCACAAISLSNALDFQQRETREARYLEIIGRYDKQIVDTFPRILGEVVMALETRPQDILGAVFHDLELHNTARGQFFTPYELCQLMAKINVGGREDLEKVIGERGFITAHEPAVGAGAMIIALAEAIKDVGINYQQKLHVTAVDVDPRAVHMAYIQFSLMHIPAEVIIGDTLRMEFRESWFTPAHIMGGWSHKLRPRKANEPLIVEPPSIESPDPAPAAEEKTGLPLFDFML
ncbi:N-6 DNA methylase [Shinella zoogloeoides]|uniref:N-6 DNA methylase n=1 Tax=Shinella zoogloeoides TaxID=352475 RepID=UPI00299CDD02|nr:N-6 DNA methylase [Shinella zoogloeoides]WPE19900.1 hypothetical protein ShzoTeo12_10760 [Shinella zoogloeoides]